MDLYRIFYYVARSGSISGAAHELFLTQPSISYAIKQLEQKLELQLLHRSSKGVTLTGEGEMLFAYVRDAYETLQAAEQKIAELKRLDTGELKLGVSGSLVRYFLLPYLEAFHRQFPHIQLRLVHGRTPDLARKLHEGAIDVGIVHLPLEDDKLSVSPLRQIQDCFIAGGDFSSLTAMEMPLRDLLELPLILLSAESRMSAFLANLAAAHGTTLHPAMELGSVDLCVEFARLGFGIAFVPELAAESELQSGRIVRLRTQETVPPRHIGIAAVKNAPLPRVAQKFMELLASGQEMDLDESNNT
ncbi:LysR family transcriptional regulator [Paenibacillus thalictri]|nr:LysR family transcriptional regulator [Paenibacillus thalictri]